MKRLFALFFLASALTVAAQPKKAPKMAPVTEPGYYVGQKKDTVRGEVQSNPDDPTAFYAGFNFKPAKGGKLMPVNTKKAKAYGYGDRHFVLHNDGGQDMYLERLVEGRINFFKRRFNGKIDGIPAVETEYFIQDTRAETADASLKQINKISTKFYKRDFKEYLKDQPMIWSDMDKFNFDEGKIVNSLNEFNAYYNTEAN